ncbi:hypothetical protein GGI35DRAFT_455527 [Trichoderma velutinum]
MRCPVLRVPLGDLKRGAGDVSGALAVGACGDVAFVRPVFFLVFKSVFETALFLGWVFCFVPSSSCGFGLRLIDHSTCIFCGTMA